MAFLSRRHNQGFTLLEMAVVATAAGFIIGGIVVAQTMIRASRLNSVLSEAARYTQAIVDFRDKYQEYPGDMSTATNYWGALDAVNATCVATASAGTPATCNGNGDGAVYKISNWNYSEYTMVWQHLANAGFVSYKYPVGASLNTSCLSNVATYPTSTLDNGRWFYTQVPSTGTYLEAGTGLAALFANSFANMHVLSIGAQNPSSCTVAPIYPVMTPSEALSIDMKIDDGLAAYGKVQVQLSTSTFTPNCSTTAVASTAAYNVAQSGILCNLIFQMDF